MRTVIYKRVSTREQADEGFSLDAQEKVLREYCESKGYELVGVYSDEGISGKDIKSRPAMVKMLDDAGKDMFDIVLVWKLTRATRSLMDLCLICDRLERCDVQLESYSESFDSNTSTGKLLLGMLGVIAQWERDVISDNVKLGLHERAAKGLPNCSLILGYDHRKGDILRVNHKESILVQRIYDLYLEIQNISKLSKFCAEKKYVGKLGGRLKPESLHRILTCFVYCGYTSWHRTPIKATHSPIIDIGMYNDVQEIMESKGAINGRKRKYPLVYLPDQRYNVDINCSP